MTKPSKTLRYVSPVDQMLEKFDETHGPSRAQRAEIKKYQRINELRDNPLRKPKDESIWEDF